MGVRNYLIAGVSGAGKTAVCTELQRRGYQAIDGDDELAYQGDPDTGLSADGLKHEHSALNTTQESAIAPEACKVRAEGMRANHAMKMEVLGGYLGVGQNDALVQVWL